MYPSPLPALRPACTRAPESRARKLPLDAAACVCVFAWLAARAAIQSITIDEADTYLAFVGRSYPSHWEAAANNHVLNSLLMRLSVALFGASQWSLRLPALAGAAIYIAAALALVRRLGGGGFLRGCILACLLCNPFVMDHLVAVRGYSMALGFLVACLALAAREAPVESEIRQCAVCSAAAALSFCANFSFAIADAALLLLISLSLARRAAARCTDGRERVAACTRVLLAAVLSGALIALLIVGSVLAEWAKGGDLVWGAATMRQTFQSVVRASLFEPNPYLLNPVLLHVAKRASALLFPALAAACALRIALVTTARRKWPPPAAFAAAIAWVSGGAAALALAGHYLLHRFFHILLPLDRTAVFLAPLAFLFAGALAAIPIETRAGRMSQRVATGVLAAFSIYFLCCLRLTYFRTWQFDADAAQLYRTLASCNHRYGVTAVSANWRYVAVLNFYRAASGDETLEPVPPGPNVVAWYPPGKDAYVLYLPADQPFVDREHLSIVYSDGATGSAVAVPRWAATQAVRLSSP